MKGLNVGISKGTEALFEKLLSERFTSEVGKGLRESAEMNNCLMKLIVCFGVPDTTLNAENPYAYQIPSSNETIIHTQIKDICERVVPELTTDNAVINEVFSRLKDVKDEMEGILGAMDASGKLFTAATIATEVGAHTAKFVTMIQNIPTQKVMKENVVPEFTEDIETLLRDGEAPKYKSDARSNFSTVLNMKEKLFKTLTEKVASAFTDACDSNLNSFLTDFARSKLNNSVSGAIKKTVGRYETNYFFQKQQESYHNQKMESEIQRTSTQPVSEQDLSTLTLRVEKIEDSGQAPSIVELKAMAASGQLGGKGLEIQTVDRDGTELSSVAFRGSDTSQGTIKLRVVREDVQTEGEKGFFTKMKETIVGKDSPWSGRFDLVSDDDKTFTKLDTSEDNSLFYAVAKATYPELSPEDVKEKAGFLRSKVGDEILRNPEKYVILHRRQQEYEAAYGDSTFFSLPPKEQSSGKQLRRGEATVGELDRSDANIVDNSFSLTRMKLSLEEKSTRVWRQLISGDKAFVMDMLKGSASLITNIATPVGKEADFTSEGEKNEPLKPTTPGAAKRIQRKLVYIPSKTILNMCSGRMGACFSKLESRWSQGLFVSMMMPLECDDQIIASENGRSYGIAEKDKMYESYRNLMVDCLCGNTDSCNPVRLLKLAMICSHPDSTLDILTSAGLLKNIPLNSEDSGELIKPEGVREGEEIPQDQDPRLGKILELDPNTGRRLEGPWGLSDEGLDAYFKVCYLVVLSKYKVADCLDEESYQQLVTWVEEDGFLDNKDQEYIDVLNSLKATE